MEFENIIELIKAVSDSSLTQFQLEEENVKITLTTNKAEQNIAIPAMGAKNLESPRLDVQVEQKDSLEVTGNIVKAPLVGTYYDAPSPDAPVFVKVGDQVAKGQVLGIVEAMKLMNEIESEYDGIVEEILVKNEGIVEYGQPMFKIR